MSGAAHRDDAVVSCGSPTVAGRIGYGSALPVAGKEWIEVQASHRIVIGDFRSAEADERRSGRAAGQEAPRVCGRVPRRRRR